MCQSAVALLNYLNAFGELFVSNKHMTSDENKTDPFRKSDILGIMFYVFV